jgi:hypothetical protein
MQASGLSQIRNTSTTIHAIRLSGGSYEEEAVQYVAVPRAALKPGLPTRIAAPRLVRWKKRRWTQANTRRR